jgi:hypothetical protein
VHCARVPNMAPSDIAKAGAFCFESGQGVIDPPLLQSRARSREGQHEKIAYGVKHWRRLSLVTGEGHDDA